MTDSSAEKETLLTRLGGAPALKAAVDDFYLRLVDDTELKTFFEGVDVGTLKKHQYKFMTIAFTKIPDDLDVGDVILKKHMRLFGIGLNEKHFDIVAGHLVATLKGLDVPENLINEVVGVVGPLRAVFEKGAEMEKAKKSELGAEEEEEIKEETLLSRLGGAKALKAAVDDFYARLVKDEGLQKFFDGVDIAFLKKHQYKFMTIAFTKIPDDLDVGGVMLEKHSRLFQMGLDETHFDMVAGHLVATLQGLDVPPNLIDEVVGIVGPLRAVFEKGAQDAKN